MKTKMIARSVTLIILAGALVACGGGGGGGSPTPQPPPPPPPPPPANVAPVAAFTGATTAVVGMPLPFDASTSSDANNDPLTYTWNFGNGQRGGGQRIAALFDAAGSFTVALTVDDARGGSNTTQRVVTVTAGPAGSGAVNTLAIVRDTSGALLEDVNVTVVAAGGATGNTGSDGRATLATERGIPVTLKFSKTGYADQFKTLSLPASAESGFLTATMLAREAPLTLASAAAGGTLTGKDGVKVTFAPNTLVDVNGAAVTGAVQVSMTPVNVATNLRAFPGRFEGVGTTGEQGMIVSYGTVEYALSAGGSPVQLAPGKKATIEVPSYIQRNLDSTPVLAGNSVPIWSLNERTGTWIQEGTGTVVAGTSPSDLALRAEVAHFSWWNMDHAGGPPGRPKPKCMADTNHDGIAEDLTGTGYCWHEATINPTQSNTTFKQLPAAVQRKQALADPVTLRLPTYAATATTPTTGGVVLPVPANVDVTFRSYAHNGTWFGQKLVRLASDVEQDEIIILAPIQDASGVVRLTLPTDTVYASHTAGEVDQFVFAAEANATYEVTVTRSTNSSLGGAVRVATTGNVQVAAGNFGLASFIGTVTPSAAGDVTLSVTSDTNAPGTYRLEVRELTTTTCGTPTSLAVPSTTVSMALPANSVTCFNVTLAADAALQVTNTQLVNVAGTVTLIAPGGEQLAMDAYSGSGAQVQLYAMLAQAGTYRLQFTNTNPTNGSITNLGVSLITLSGTLTVPDSATFAGPSDAITSRWYAVKPAAIGSEFALRVNGNGVNQNFRVQPFATPMITSDLTGLVVRKSALVHPLIQVTRAVGNTAWNFNLETGVPLSLPLDTDVAVTGMVADQLRIYRYDAGAGQLVSLGWQSDSNQSVNPNIELPTAQLPAISTNGARIYTVQQDGVQTLLARNNALTSGDFTVRLNTVPAFVPLVLAGVNDLTSTLALGQVKRYRFDVTQGQVVSVNLAAPGSIDAQAMIEGSAVTGGTSITQFNTSPPRARSSGALFVAQTGIADLLVYGTGQFNDTATGEVTATVHSPTPVPTALGALVSATLTQGGLRTYAYNVPAAGRHLLCVKNVNGSFSIVNAFVWGPAPNDANGDIGEALSGQPFLEYLGTLRQGANTLSLLTPVPSVAVDARLVELAAPSGLTLGAPAGNGTLGACERDYFNFAGTAGQAYTVRVTATFAGEVRVRKLAASGDHTQRLGSGNFEDNLGGTPLALIANTERVVSFTIPNNATFGTGTYLVEVDGTEDASGTYSVSATTP